jgi:UDP-N-acetylmuramate--alanine ligase
MLGEITRLKRGVAVAGTHGKTTTTAMIASVLAEAGLDPTLIVGGVLRDFATNARLGSGEWLVVEADEYDRSFLTLHPEIAVVTNIEADHLDIYSGIDDIRATFADFASRVPFYGTVIGCADDANVATSSRRSRAGRSATAWLAAAPRHRDRSDEHGASLDVSLDGRPLGRGALVPGEHNVRNSLAHCDRPGLDIRSTPSSRRRPLAVWSAVSSSSAMQRRDRRLRTATDPGDARGGAPQHPDRRIIALSSRTFLADAQSSTARAEVADVAYVAPTPAREEPIAGVTAALINDAAAPRAT